MDEIEDIIAKAMSASKAWPVVFEAGSAAELARAAVAALDAAGFVIAPKEASLAMQNAGWHEVDKQGFSTEDTEVAPIYRAMIGARLK